MHGLRLDAVALHGGSRNARAESRARAAIRRSGRIREAATAGGSVSPPAPGLRGELVEVRMPAGATVSFDTSPIAGLEHHLWMLEGSLTLEVEGRRSGCAPATACATCSPGPTQFKNPGKREARYLVAMVRP